MRIYKWLQIVLLVIVSWFLVIPAYAVGISVTPPELRLTGSPNKKITGTFTVTNPSRETVIYEITNDGLLTLTITPTTFLLEPNKSANVAVEYSPPLNPLLSKEGTGVVSFAAQELEGRSQTTLSILGRPLTVQPTQAASGIKLPVTIQTAQVAGASTHRYDPFSIGIMIIDSLLVLWLAYLFIKHRLKILPLVRGR